jgi:hypothetical protein
MKRNRGDASRPKSTWGKSPVKARFGAEIVTLLSKNFPQQ